MGKELLEHESEAADIISRQPRILLFDEMGVGKTVSTLEGIRRVSESGYLNPYKCIVVAPNTILGQWADEISEWLDGSFKCVIATGDFADRSSKYEFFRSYNGNVILLTNYNFIIKDQFFRMLGRVDTLVIDEGFLLRNRNTKAYKFLKHYQGRADRLIMISGNADSLKDRQLYDLVDLVFSGEFNRYIVMSKDSPRDYLIESLGERYISRDSSVVSGGLMPDLEPDIKPVELEFNFDQKRLLSSLALEENRQRKSALYSSRVYVNKRLLLVQSPRIFDITLGNSPKEEFLLELFGSTDGKVVVYCPDKKFFKLLKTDLDHAGIRFVMVSGEMPLYLRDRSLRLFKNDGNVRCLLMSGVGKFGLNLQVSHTLVCMCVPKTRFDLDQLLGRLNRINQVERVVCYIPYHQNTVEEERIKKLTGKS